MTAKLPETHDLPLTPVSPRSRQLRHRPRPRFRAPPPPKPGDEVETRHGQSQPESEPAEWGALLRKLNSLDEFDPKALELMGSECFKSWLSSFHQEQDHFQSFALHSETQLMQMLDATKHMRNAHYPSLYVHRMRKISLLARHTYRIF